MRKLVVQQWVTVDNIAAEEDGGLSFVSGEPFSESTSPAFKASVMGLIDSVDTMILGANTYAQAKGYWPYADDQGEYGEKLNNLTKFVASSKLDDAPWGDFPAATVTRDPAATIRELKEQSGKDIWLWGSLKLMHSLLEAGVVDEVRMLVCPASRGKGTRIFEVRQDLKLVEGTSFETAWSSCATRSRNRRKVRISKNRHRDQASGLVSLSPLAGRQTQGSHRPRRLSAVDPFRAAVRPVLERLGPLPEELVLALVLGERRRPAELARRFRGPAELPQQIAAHAVQQVVAVEGARRAELVDGVEAGLRPEGHRDGDRSVELDDRRWRDLGELAVQRDDPRPVRVDAEGDGVARRDHRLERVGTAFTVEGASPGRARPGHV